MVELPEPNTAGFEIFKAGLTAAVTVLGLMLTWLVGHRLTSRWAVWQKRREAEMATSAEFYRLYGEFVEVWRLWKVVKNDLKGAERDAEWWKLLQRASAAEGALEAICIKIATEHRLTPEQAAALGGYRKLYQELRQRIRRGRPLDWDYETTAYQRFKSYSGEAACILAGPAGKPPSPEEATANLAAVTRPRRRDVLGEIDELDELEHDSDRFKVTRVGFTGTGAAAAKITDTG